MMHSLLGILTEKMRILHIMVVTRDGIIYQVQISNDPSGRFSYILFKISGLA
jgi:Holliday junction resolvasome RuvABC DNA-binding subunit